METLSEQLSAIAYKRNGNCKKFLRAYKSNLRWNKLQIWESWNFLKTIDRDLEPCEALFRSCWQNAPSLGGIFQEINDDTSCYTNYTKFPAFESKSVEFLTESEFLELRDTIGLFMDLLIPYFLQPQVQTLVDYLIYKYELAERFSETVLVNFLQYHCTSYFVKLVSMLTLPPDSELSLYIANIGDPLREKKGIEREDVVRGTVKSFSNYKKICEAVHRIIFTRKKYENNGAFIAFYNVISVAYVEEKKNSLKENEIRFILHNVLYGFNHPEYPAYYSTQMCTISVLASRIPLSVAVQGSIVKALLNPILEKMKDLDNLPLNLRLDFSDAMTLLAILQQQKEHVNVLGNDTMKLFLEVIKKHPSISSCFQVTNADDQVINFSRVLRLFLQSIFKYFRYLFAKNKADFEKSSENLDDLAFDHVNCLFLLLKRINMAKNYVKLLLLSIIDELHILASTCHNHGETLFSFDFLNPQELVGNINPKHISTLLVIKKILITLQRSHPALLEKTLRENLLDDGGLPDNLDVFLFFCYCISNDSPKRLMLTIHRYSGRKIGSFDEMIPSGATCDNLHDLIELYLEPHMQLETRRRLYKLLSEALVREESLSVGLSESLHSMILEFLVVTLKDPSLVLELYSNRQLWVKIPTKHSCMALTNHIGDLLATLDYGVSVTVSFGICERDDNKGYRVDMESFFGALATILTRESDLNRQLQIALSLFCDLYERTGDEMRGIMNNDCSHFMIFMNTVSLEAQKSGELFKICKRYLHISKTAETEISLSHKKTSGLAYRLLRILSNLNESISSGIPCNGMYPPNFVESTILQKFPTCDTVESGSSHCTEIWWNWWLACFILYHLTDNMYNEGILTDENVCIFHSLSIIIASQICMLRKNSALADIFDELVWNFVRENLKVITLSIQCLGQERFHEFILMEQMLLILSNDDLLQGFYESLSLTSLKFRSNRSIWLRHCFECSRLSASALNPKIYSASHKTCVYKYMAERNVEFKMDNDNNVLMNRLFNFSLKDAYFNVMIILELFEGINGPQEFHYAKFSDMYRSIETSDFGDLKIPFLSLLDKNNSLAVFSRCMDCIRAIFSSIIEIEGISMPNLLLDSMVNILEFLLSKDLGIRRESFALLLSIFELFDAKKSAGSQQCEALTICSYPFIKTSPFKSVDKFYTDLETSLRQWCNYLIRKKRHNKVSGDVFYAFSNFLADYCRDDENFALMLLSKCLTSGTTAIFNVDVIKCLMFILPTPLDGTMHGLDIVMSDILAYIDGIILEKISPFKNLSELICSDLVEMKHHIILLSLISTVISVSEYFSQESKGVFFAEKACLNVLDMVCKLNSIKISMENDKNATNICSADVPNQSLGLLIKEISALINDCTVICMFNLKGGWFWNIKDRHKRKFLRSFIEAHQFLDSINISLVIRWVFSLPEDNQSNCVHFLKEFYSVKSVAPNFVEIILMNVINSINSLEILEEIFETIIISKIHNAKTATKLLSTILLKLIIGTSIHTKKIQEFVCTSTGRLLNFAKVNIEAESDREPNSISSEVCDYLNSFYRAMWKLLSKEKDQSVYVNLNSIFDGVCSFLHSLLRSSGIWVFDFLEPLLKNMLMTSIKSYSLKERDTNLRNICRNICGLLIGIFTESFSFGEDFSSIKRFLLMNRVFSTNDESVFAHVVYEEWLSRSICACFYVAISHRDKLHHICMDLVGKSGNIVKIAATIIWSVIFLTVESTEYTQIDGFSQNSENFSTNNSDQFSYKKKSPELKLEIATTVYGFIASVVDAFSDRFLLEISAECFNNHKCSAYLRFKSVSEFMQSIVFSLVAFKPGNKKLIAISSENLHPRKKKKLSDISNRSCAEGTYDRADIHNDMCKTIEAIARKIYGLNLAFNFHRITLGILGFFSDPNVYSPKGKSSLAGVTHDNNFWFTECYVDLSKTPWAIEYLYSILCTINSVYGIKFLNFSSGKTNEFSRELDIISTKVYGILTDFVYYCDLCNMKVLKTAENVKAVMEKCRSAIWSYFVRSSHTLSFGAYGHVFRLLVTTFGNLSLTFSGLKDDSSSPVYSDFINSIKLLLSMAAEPDLNNHKNVEIDQLLELCGSVSRIVNFCLIPNLALSRSAYISVILVMLTLCRSFGRATGRKFLESAIAMVLYFRDEKSEKIDYSFNLPAKENYLTDTNIKNKYYYIRDEYLRCNSDTMSDLMAKGSIKCGPLKTPSMHMVMILAYYTSVQSKTSFLIKMFLKLDSVEILIRKLEMTARLLRMLAINIRYNSLRSKYVENLQKIYLISVNYSLSFNAQTLVEYIDTEVSKNGYVENLSSLRQFFPSRNMPQEMQQTNELSASMFTPLFIDGYIYDGVDIFEGSFIAFSLQYFSKITSNHLMELFETHLSVITSDEDLDPADYLDVELTSINAKRIANLHIRYRLFLRILVAALNEYGECGATQFVIPRLYQSINDILSFSINSARLNHVTIKEELSLENVWIWFDNSILVLKAIQLSAKTWNSGLPEICLNTWLPTIRQCIFLFDIFSENSPRVNFEGTNPKITEQWAKALEDTLMELIYGHSNDDERIRKIEACLSENIVERSRKIKASSLHILNNMWAQGAVHLAPTLRNLVSQVNEMMDDEDGTVRYLAQVLNEKIQAILESNE